MSDAVLAALADVTAVLRSPDAAVPRSALDAPALAAGRDLMARFAGLVAQRVVMSRPSAS